MLCFYPFVWNDYNLLLFMDLFNLLILSTCSDKYRMYFGTIFIFL